jgi:hypothetical protein
VTAQLRKCFSGVKNAKELLKFDKQIYWSLSMYILKKEKGVYQKAKKV